MAERKTRFQIIRLIPDKTSSSVNRCLSTLQNEYIFKLITADNAPKFMRLDEVMSWLIYYVYPYASYERGSNENANRLIRR